MIAAHPALVWILGGLALLVAEVMAPGAFMMWLGIAAIGTGGSMLLLPLSLAWQVLLFAVLAAGAIATGLRLRRPAVRHLNTPQSGLVGRQAHAVSFQNGEGRVRIGDSEWPARLAPGAAMPEPGAALLVTEVDGIQLVVRPV